MSNWENLVRKVVPYTPGEQPKNTNVIKLNTNENPYPPAPGVREALQALSEDDVRRYPDPTIGRLVSALANRAGVRPEQVFVGVGSDDVLAMAFLTFFNGEEPVLFPDITYSFYDVWADLFRIPYRCPALNDALQIDPADYLCPNGGIVLANPNAPTGLLLETESIEKIVAANPDVVVIVDEAYIDFGGTSVLPLIDRYENLLVVQTFSKSRSMAGMRIGCAYGSEKLIRYLLDAKYSFNSYTLNAAAIAAGTASVADEAYFAETVKKVVATRERVKPLFAELGFTFGDSMSNFLFVKHDHVPAKEIFTGLRKNNIFVRYFNKPRIDQYLRITIGTDREMDILLAFLRDMLCKG